MTIRVTAQPETEAEAALLQILQRNRNREPQYAMPPDDAAYDAAHEDQEEPERWDGMS